MQSLGMINFWTFLIGSVFVITIPGPNMLYVLSVSAQRGVRHAYRAVCGIFLGDSILMTLSAAGVASLLKAYPILFFIIKYGGAAYLLYMGLTILRTAWLNRGSLPAPASANKAESGHCFKRALLISLCNPKAILFFVSFFIQFVDPAYPYPALSFLALGAIDQLISLSYLSLLIFTGVRLSEAFRRHRCLSIGASGSAGALLIGFSLKLATATLG
ncbi:Putative homoserine/threonine efflux protein [Candidatus Glomeribacter gigasporarum BEG34]|uniref:Putative homoserine/threonine efflux protein n=1 Tax=Candidatus Glomeribacter gigasporarum BEG34 TaxID=1070319 RepID=G2JB60_9BURK|nr:leucine efflux protein LeuE [Candidatus Glomeribacter gigasporarum]CCD30012.1 Putative homoserine/threonine efflux protein [Candidatus Glomeribacter gigasporarum BEG34]